MLVIGIRVREGQRNTSRPQPCASPVQRQSLNAIISVEQLTKGCSSLNFDRMAAAVKISRCVLVSSLIVASGQQAVRDKG